MIKGWSNQERMSILELFLPIIQHPLASIHLLGECHLPKSQG